MILAGCIGNPLAPDENSGNSCDDDLDIPNEVREALPEYDTEPEDIEDRKRELSSALHSVLVPTYDWAFATSRPSGPIVNVEVYDKEEADAYVPEEWGCITIVILEGEPPETS